MLEQVGDLGIVDDGAEGLSPIAVARVVEHLGHEVDDAIGALEVIGGEERRVCGETDLRGERTRADGHLADIDKLSHDLAFLIEGR